MAGNTTPGKPANTDRDLMDGAQQQQTVAPGWHPDPQAPGPQRWWDGRRWTEHISSPPGPAPPALKNRLTVDNPTGTGRTADLVLTAAVIAMGLLTGLFYAFDVAVMPALTAADDRTLVDAMQQMIDLPAFPLTLLAAPALAAVALFQARRSGSATTARWILAALAFYTVTIVVTFAVHFPLNDGLQEAGDPARIEDLAALRDDFVTPWVAWNIVRTLALTAAFSCLAWALILRGRMGRAV